MIRIVGSDLKELYKWADFCKSDRLPSLYHQRDPIIGFYKGEEVFLCPYPLIERERGACDRCKHRFECYTDKWGLPE